MPDGLLAHLAGADLHHRLGEDGHDLRCLRVGGLLVRLGEVVVADNDGRLVTKARGHGGATAPGRGAVDDVVVHQRGGVRQLDRHRGGHQPVKVIGADPRGEKDECRPDPFAAGREQVRHRR